MDFRLEEELDKKFKEELQAVCRKYKRRLDIILVEVKNELGETIEIRGDFISVDDRINYPKEIKN